MEARNQGRKKEAEVIGLEHLKNEISRLKSDVNLKKKKELTSLIARYEDDLSKLAESSINPAKSTNLSESHSSSSYGTSDDSFESYLSEATNLQSSENSLESYLSEAKMLARTGSGTNLKNSPNLQRTGSGNKFTLTRKSSFTSPNSPKKNTASFWDSVKDKVKEKKIQNLLEKILQEISRLARIEIAASEFGYFRLDINHEFTNLFLKINKILSNPEIKKDLIKYLNDESVNKRERKLLQGIYDLNGQVIYTPELLHYIGYSEAALKLHPEFKKSTLKEISNALRVELENVTEDEIQAIEPYEFQKPLATLKSLLLAEKETDHNKRLDQIVKQLNLAIKILNQRDFSKLDAEINKGIYAIIYVQTTALKKLINENSQLQSQFKAHNSNIQFANDLATVVNFRELDSEKDMKQQENVIFDKAKSDLSKMRNSSIAMKEIPANNNTPYIFTDPLTRSAIIIRAIKSDESLYKEGKSSLQVRQENIKIDNSYPSKPSARMSHCYTYIYGTHDKFDERIRFYEISEVIYSSNSGGIKTSTNLAAKIDDLFSTNGIEKMDFSVDTLTKLEKIAPQLIHYLSQIIAFIYDNMDLDWCAVDLKPENFIIDMNNLLVMSDLKTIISTHGIADVKILHQETKEVQSTYLYQSPIEVTPNYTTIKSSKGGETNVNVLVLETIAFTAMHIIRGARPELFHCQDNDEYYDLNTFKNEIESLLTNKNKNEINPLTARKIKKEIEPLLTNEDIKIPAGVKTLFNTFLILTVYLTKVPNPKADETNPLKTTDVRECLEACLTQLANFSKNEVKIHQANTSIFPTANDKVYKGKSEESPKQTRKF